MENNKLREILKDIPEEKHETIKSIFSDFEKETIEKEQKEFNKKIEEKEKILNEREQILNEKEEQLIFEKEFSTISDNQKKIVKELVDARKQKNNDYNQVISSVKNDFPNLFDNIIKKQTVFPNDTKNIIPEAINKQKLNDYSNDILAQINPELKNLSSKNK